MADYRPSTVRNVVIGYMQFWARLLVRLRRPCIVGITGSAGKSTTARTIAGVLTHERARASLGEVWRTSGNMNNDDGLPLVVLGFTRVPKSHAEYLRWLAAMPFRVLAYATGARRYPRVLVLEYGAGQFGDIPTLVDVARPTIAVVTTVGPAHLDHFGTVEAVANAKAALVRALPRTGLAVLGADSPHAVGMAELTAARVELVPGRGRPFAEHAARIVGAELGLEQAVVEAGLATHVVVDGRQQVIETASLTIVNDAFNANPLSMRFGLDLLAEQARPGQRTVVVIGDMGELGADSTLYHREIGAYAHERADLVIGVGELARAYAPDAWYPTAAACTAALADHVRHGDLVFVKGSHSVHLRDVARALRDMELIPGASHADPAR